MAITLPKLPKPKNSFFDFEKWRRPHINNAGEVHPIPDWVEWFSGYGIKSCERYMDWIDEFMVVTHVDDTNNGFMRAYVLEGGKPFKHMDELWRRLETIGHFYVKDGRIYGTAAMSSPPDPDMVNDVLSYLKTWHDAWLKFPNAPTWEIVERLRDALSAVDAIKEEEQHGHVRKRIEKIRASIKNEQEEIMSIERNLTSMYERAAEGMNLLEEYGVKVDLNV